MRSTSAENSVTQSRISAAILVGIFWAGGAAAFGQGVEPAIRVQVQKPVIVAPIITATPIKPVEMAPPPPPPVIAPDKPLQGKMQYKLVQKRIPRTDGNFEIVYEYEDVYVQEVKSNPTSATPISSAQQNSGNLAVVAEPKITVIPDKPVFPKPIISVKPVKPVPVQRAEKSARVDISTAAEARVDAAGHGWSRMWWLCLLCTGLGIVCGAAAALVWTVKLAGPKRELPAEPAIPSTRV